MELEYILYTVVNSLHWLIDSASMPSEFGLRGNFSQIKSFLSQYIKMKTYFLLS